MKIAAAKAIANCVKEPTKERIVPDTFDKDVGRQIKDHIKNVL